MIMMAVAWIQGNQISYASVDNITGYLVRVKPDQDDHKLEQLNMARGMISGSFRKLNVQTLTLSESDLLIMHSDGLTPTFNLDSWQEVLGDCDKLERSFLENQGKATAAGLSHDQELYVGKVDGRNRVAAHAADIKQQGINL